MPTTTARRSRAGLPGLLQIHGGRGAGRENLQRGTGRVQSADHHHPGGGRFAPDSADDDLAKYPAILVGTSEACEDGLLDLIGTRFYAILHDGYENASGPPFLPDSR
jgi:hypothetical protein